MAIERWNPRREPTRQEEFLLRRLDRVRKLLGFLRMFRHLLFDDAFQAKLAAMYRDTGAGKPARPPALMAMACLVQGYLGVSDAEMVELTVVDLRVQMVLDRLGEVEPAFSQGALCDFRGRMIAHDLDRELLERTVEVARTSKAFDPKKLRKTLRIAINSSPLEGAGRVEDTFNLLAHAARKVVACAAGLLEWPEERVCREAGIPLLLASSVKKGLDIDWNDGVEKAGAIKTLTGQLDSLQRWLEKRLPDELVEPPLKDEVATLNQIRNQDLEPDPGGGGQKIREGVAKDRRVSIEDPEMRHGRKSKSKRFNGYKRHIAADVDTGLIHAATVTPANRPEEEAAPALLEDLKRQGAIIGECLIDRGYINSIVVDDVLANRGGVICRPWNSKNKKLFPKSAFTLNMRNQTITCPAGHTESFETGRVAEFASEVCDRCPLRSQCTTAELGSGRTVAIAEDERLQQRLRKLVATPRGRARLRDRVDVEHRLAHVTRRQGRRARYKGARKNTFDLRRAASIQNLEVLHRREAAVELAKAS